MSKSFTVDVSDKQDRTFYVYVVKGDTVSVTSTFGGYIVSGSWISSHSGTDDEQTLTAGITGYYKTTITGMSNIAGDVGYMRITFAFPREQLTLLKVEAQDLHLDFLEKKEVVVAASATPDYPINVTVDGETSPLVETNANYVLTGEDDHILCASYNRISSVTFAASVESEWHDDGTYTIIYTRIPQEIVVSYTDDVVADKNTIDIVATTDGAIIDNYAKKYELSDNQSEEKRDYTISNTYISATWRQGPGWYRTITYPYVWLTGVDVWVSHTIDQWGNEGLHEGTIEYRHGTNYGYYITVPWLCSEVYLYGVVRAYGSDSEPTSSEIAWNGREFSQQSGDDCGEWVRFDTCQNTTGERVIKKISNSLGGTSYEVPIYLIFEPNPDLEETKLLELGGNTKYAGDIDGSVYFYGTGGLYEDVELDDDQEYKTSSTYKYQVSPRNGSDAILVSTGEATEVALLTWGDSKAENESSKFWMNVSWEAFCSDESISLSISKQTQALSVLKISVTKKDEEDEGDEGEDEDINAKEYTVYVRPTSHDPWISFVIALNPTALDEEIEVVYDPSNSLKWDYEGDVKVKVQHTKSGVVVDESDEVIVEVTQNKSINSKYYTGTIKYKNARHEDEDYDYSIRQYYPSLTVTIYPNPIYINWDETYGEYVFVWTMDETGEVLYTSSASKTGCVTGINPTTSERVFHETVFTGNGEGAPIGDTVYVIQGAAPEMEYGCEPDPGHIGAEGGYVEFTPWRKRVSNGATDYEASFSRHFSPNEEAREVTKSGTQYVSAWNYYVPFNCIQDAGTGSSSGGGGDTGSTTYTYEISPETATVGAEGGDVVFTLTRIGSDGSTETATETITIGANTTTEEVTHTGTITLWGHGFTYTIVQEAADEEEPGPSPEPDPEVTYTYTVSPETASVGAEGGTITFTFTRTGSDGSVATETRDVTIAANTTTEAIERTISITIDDWGYTFSVTIKQDAGTGSSSGGSGGPNTGAPPVVIPDDGDGEQAHVKYMQLSNIGEQRFGVTHVDVVLEGNNRTDFSRIFATCEYLTEINEDVFSNCTSALSFESAFEGCSCLQEIPGKIFYATRQVTNFRNVFADCNELVSVPETLFQTNTQAVDFSGAFSGSMNIASLPSGLFANCTRAENFSYTFYSAGIMSVPGSLFYSCLRVTDFSYTFANSSLKSIPGTLFRNNTKAKDFTGVFSNCSNLTEVSETLFDNCYRAESFAEAFWNDTALEEIPDGLFRFMTSATNFSGVFGDCEKISSIPANTFENCTSAEDFSEAFFWDAGLKTVPDGLFKSCSNATNFESIFVECSSLTYVPHDLFCATAKNANFACAFQGCAKLSQAGYNLYHVNEDTYQLFSNDTSAGVLQSHSSLRRVYLWNLTSAGLEEMGEYSDFIPTTTHSATVYIGKIVTDDDRFSGALTGSNREQIASSKLVSKLLSSSKKYTCVYIGTCELGSKEFKSEGYVETAGVFIERSETLTLPSE